MLGSAHTNDRTSAGTHGAGTLDDTTAELDEAAAFAGLEAAIGGLDLPADTIDALMRRAEGLASAAWVAGVVYARETAR